MTPKAQAILQYIHQYIKAHRIAPTITEIGKNNYINSRGTIGRYVQQLSEEGYLILHPGKQRNIELTAKAKAMYDELLEKAELSLPLLGKIAAGRPIEAILNQERIDFSFLVSEGHYALKVVGNSMVDEGIVDGDLVVCRYAQTANNGEIVVALVNAEFATLKAFFYDREKQKVTLKPANMHMEPMIYDAHQIEVQGIMVGLLRMTHHQGRKDH